MFSDNNFLYRVAPFGFIAFMSLLLFAPYLFLGKISVGEEHLGAYYPALHFYQQAITEGASFLWNSFYYGGFPTYLNLFGGFLYPLHTFLFQYFSLFTAYSFALFIPVLLGVVFSYLFGRANSFSKTGSLILAFTYLLGQTLPALDTGLSYANGFMVLPVLFFVVAKLRRYFSEVTPPKIKIGGMIALGIAGSAVGFLAGFPQTVLYGMVFAFFYALFLDMQQQGSFWGRFRVTGSLLAMVAGGAVLAAPQLLATFEYLDVSVRTAEHTAQVSEPLLFTQLGVFLLPPTVEIPRILVGIPGIYIGVLPLVFALASIVFFRTRHVLFFTLAYLVMFFMAIDAPIISLLNEKLPIFSRISNPARWLYVAVFAAGFLAAHGYEKIRSQSREWFLQKGPRRFLNIFGLLSLLVIIGAVAGGVLLSFVVASVSWQQRIFDFLLARGSFDFPSQHYWRTFQLFLQDAHIAVSFANWKFVAAVLFFPASWWVLYRFQKRHSHRWLSMAVLLVVTVNLSGVFMGSWDTLVSRSVLTTEPAAVTAIKERETDFRNFRILPFLTSNAVFHEIASQRRLTTEERLLVNREILTGSINTLYGVENMYGYEPFRPMRHNQLIDGVVAPQSLAVFDRKAVQNGASIRSYRNEAILRDATLEEKKRDFLQRLPLLSMMNVKYIVSVYPLKDVRLEEVFKRTDPIPIHVYENKEVRPRIYFAENPVFWRGDERSLLLALAETEGLEQKTFLECPREYPACVFAGGDAGEYEVEIIAYENGLLELQTTSENDGWLVFSESALPGWAAYKDGRPVPIYRANYIFQAVYVPAGEHEIRFEYRL